MQPLPGDRPGRWRRGVCLQQVGPRSYLVDVEGTLYRRNRVALRPAEKDTSDRPQEGQVADVVLLCVLDLGWPTRLPARSSARIP
uniref:Uncharacterized protein n=1 Tax=Knipowitschia caucasica TaxID=637954 RepID=A0AAV2KIL5_KNICA